MDGGMMIMKELKCSMKQQEPILVAIRCTVYNHEPYLRDCLEGFVMQKTNFRFVAVVHDDASTDGSAAIIREYEEKYPDIIKPIYEIENQYSKHDGSLGRIMNAAIDATGAKYIATCEGDDYWTDPLKLQKQVDFLESHPDFTMCFHGARIKNETNTIVITTCDKVETKEYLTKDIFPGWVVPTASVVYRREPVESYPPLKHQEWMKYGDIVLFLKCTHTGRVWGMADHMSVYRMTENGAVVRQKNENDYYLHLCKHYEFLMLNFPQLDHSWPNRFIAKHYYSQMRKYNQLSDAVYSLWMVITHDSSYLREKLIDGVKNVMKSF